MTDVLGYVGPSQVHDAVIESVETAADLLVVTLRADSGSGAAFRVEFDDPSAVDQNRSIGMMLYALAELRSDSELRRFSFVNSDDDDDAHLSLDATRVRWSVSW